MIKIRKAQFNYKIACINETDYVLHIINDMPVSIFEKGLMRVLDKVTAKNLIDNVEEYNIPDGLKSAYLKPLMAGLMTQINEVKKIVDKDGIELITYEPKDAIFRKSIVDGVIKWDCKLEIRGVYNQR